MRSLVSILIPAFNAERWITETIESVLAQTWPSKEIIIVDDGSTDNTHQIIRKYESKPLKLITQANQGASAARNKALSHAQGDYIQWLDADDILGRDKIKKQMEVIGEEGSRVLATSEFGSFYYRIEKAIFKETGIWKDLNPLEWSIIRLKENVWIQAASWLMSREICRIAGPWDERLCLDEDGEYFCRVVSRSNGIKFVKGARSYYRTGNYGSQCMNRSNRALESMLLSMELTFKHLRSMEDSERTRNACLTFLQNRLLDIYPYHGGIIERMKILAQELGGVLSMPEVNWKLYAAKKVLGWRQAIMIRNRTRKIRTSIAKSIDKLLYNTEVNEK